MALRLLEVEPIYGYGWSCTGASETRETPTPFMARVAGSVDKGWIGKVEMPAHEFDGQAIRMSKRHTVFDGTVNVILDGIATGFAVVT